MNNDLISREALKIEIEKQIAYCDDKSKHQSDMEEVLRYANTSYGLRLAHNYIENAPTVDTKELNPLVDKVVEILPELTDAIIKELPIMVSGKIKCSECSYYTNTFNGEWVRKEDLIHYIATQYSEHNELVPVWLSIGDLKGGAE